MGKIIEQLVTSNDVNLKNEAIHIMAECCELGMDGATYLDMQHKLKETIGNCHYDEDMAILRLHLNKNVHCKKAALDNYIHAEHYDINQWDFVVLWAEMENIHGEKIRKWFPKIQEIDFEAKILDECISFLESDKTPFCDL